MHDNCDDCQKLWGDYAHATTYLSEADGRQRQAAANRDFKKFAEADADVAGAHKKRSVALGAIKQHEKAKHGGPADPIPDHLQ